MSAEETGPDGGRTIGTGDRSHAASAKPVPENATRRPGLERRPSRSWFSIGFRVGLGVLTAYWMVRSVQHMESVLMLVLLSLVIAVSADPLVSRLTERGLGRAWAVVTVIVGLFLVLGGLSALFIVPATHEISAVAHQVPTWLQQLHDHHSFLGRMEDRYQIIEKAKERLGTDTSSLADGVMGAGQLLVTTVTGLFLVIILTIYFLAGLPALKRFCLRFVPGSRRDHTTALVDEILLRTGRYMLANVATSAIAGLATFIWLVTWGVPYPAALGVFVALMDLIPVVGSTIGGIVVSLVALVVSLPVAIATAVFYVVFRLAEDYLILPRAMKFAIQVHPLVTVLAVLAGGTLEGIIGALLAIPVAVAVGLILDDAVFPRIARR